MNYNAKTRMYRTLVYIFFLLLAIVVVAPIWILLVNATRTSPEIQQGLSLIPGTNLINNWNTIAGKGLNLTRGLMNSMFIAFTTTFLSVYFGLMTAYAVSAFNFKFKKQFYALVLLMVMVPAQLSIVGLYDYVAGLGLLNSYVPIILPAAASATTVFFMKQYLDGALVPELLQAARIDGAGEFKIFNKIVLPIAAPGAFTVGIFTFVASWNNFMVPFTLITKKELYTLPMLMQTLKGDTYRTDYGGVYLGMAVTVIPILFVYAMFSKNIVSGISMGSVKD